ncbi:MAG: tetratricopeptide repeat protein [bacterium]
MKKGVFVILVLAIVVVIGVTVIFFMSSKPNDKPLYDYVSEGIKFLETKEYSNASLSFKKAINQNSSDSNAYIELSNIYIQKNDYNLAIDLLKPVADKLENSSSLYYQLASIYFKLKSYDKAEEYLLKIAPEYVVPNDLRLGRTGDISSKDVVKLFSSTLNAKDKNDESKKLIETYLENSKSTDAYLNIIASLLNYASLDTSNSYYSRVVSFDETDGVEILKKASDELKSTLDKTKADTKGELADTNKANIARLLIQFNFNTPGINIISDVISRNLEFDLLYQLRGIGYYQKADLDKALIDLEKSNSLNPTSEETLIYLARLYDQKSNVQKSIETFEQAVSLYPNNEFSLHDYAKMLYKDEMYSKSVIQYLKLIAKNTSKLSEYRIELAKIYLDKVANYDEILVIVNELQNKWGGYKDSLPEVKADINTLDTWARYNKELTTKPELINLDTYIANINKSLELDPTNVRANFYLGELYVLKKDFVKGKSYLEKSIDYDLQNEFTSEANNIIETKIK